MRLILLKMLELDQMLASNVVKWDIFNVIVNIYGDKPSDSQVQGQTALDSYDPVVGKLDDQFGGHYSYHSKSHANSDNRTQ